ncbi:tetratricopeptide repeat-containing sensor histidine kinase [Robiginitalea sp. IMCC44478]|uniref:tetratricopeptide repeat-containing sensor histidine kinase n=1 Tax=Robiginitalea sp. IMCC44478 TaxID=3459122 RepID=UPI004041ABF8
MAGSTNIFTRYSIRKATFGMLSLSILLSFGGHNKLLAQSNSQKRMQQKIKSLKNQEGFSPRDTAYINLLNDYALEMRFFDTDSLLKLANEAMRLSKESGYARGLSYSHLRIGDYWSDKGNTEKAIHHYSKGLELAKVAEDKKLELRLLNNLSGEYAYKSDYSRALGGYLEALELAESLEALLLQSIINENIANLYATQKDYEEALTYFKKVKKINTNIGDEVIQAETMSNLASLYADMSELDYAIFNINQSIKVFDENQILDWLAYAYEIKGKIYLKKYNYKWALYWYQLSEILHKQLEDDRSRIDLLNGMSEAYLGLEEDSLARNYAIRAFKITEKINFVEGKQKCALTLYKVHKKAGEYPEALVYHELYQQLKDSLSRRENRQSLSLHKTKAAYERQKLELIEENEKALARQKRYIQAGWSMLLISLIISYLIYRSKKLQKRLNTELQEKKDILEVRKTELIANNETKTKLFSIIGHDLRGPIGALQGLLKMFKDGDVNKEEFLSFIPKLRADVDHIYFTLNNLLSWGQSQLNGSKTKPADVSLENIVEENINLLSEIAENKSIKIVSEVAPNTLLWSDPNHLDIIVRNLISNALKFTPENGMVTIKAVEKAAEWEISIRDTGVGIDRMTLQKIFEEKSNHSTYGTANEKGTGLGLSLCKEMVENNNGTIWVESILRKGSTFYFTMPKSTKNYSKAG